MDHNVNSHINLQNHTGIFMIGIFTVNIHICEKSPVRCNCADGIETEGHVLRTCPFYVDLRTELYESINDILFQTLNDEQKMCYMLSNSECVYNVARTCYEILERRKFLTYV